MKKIVLLILLFAFISNINAYEKQSLVERYTNCSCGPCAALNNAWYNATTQALINAGLMTHIVYNVNWPSEYDPMFLLNATDNISRWTYYGVNSVPWVDINGTTFNTGSGATAFTNAINSGNAEYAPFKIILTPERFSNNVINIHVKILRDPTDNTVFEKTKLRVALTERVVDFTSPPGSNGETMFYSISRKMLPDGKGIEFAIPAPGDSIEIDLVYIPTAEFIASVDFDSIRVAAFIQSDIDKEVYQSTMTNLVYSNHINAAFQVDEYLGAAPFTVTFNDYSTATDSTSLNSWAWDFDNNGTTDSNEPNPAYIFNDNQSYSVSLTVSDGYNSYTRMMNNFITVLTASSKTLVVNGIDYQTDAYKTEMENFYNNSACYGNHNVDVWDLFGDEGFDFTSNPKVQQVHLFSRNIPTSILNLYDNIIWIGNNYSGDVTFYDPNQVIEYVQSGKNFLLATRLANSFFNTELKNYCGIDFFSGDLTVANLISLDNNLVDMTAVGTNSLVNFPQLSATSEAVPIFDDNTGTNWTGGFKIKKENEGAFIFIGGRPYRYDNTASFANYDYIISNWMAPASIDEEISLDVAATSLSDTLGSEMIFDMTVVNISSVEQTVFLVRTLNELPSGWQSSLCFGENCFSPALDSIASTIEFGVEPLAPGDTLLTSLHVFPNVTDGTANVQLQIGTFVNPADRITLDFTATASATAVDDKQIKPDHYFLSQNYPNPFNPSTTIYYGLKEAGMVSLKVYNMLGAEVATLVNEYKPAGSFNVSFDASTLSSGIYFYKLETNNYVQVNKMILEK